MSVKRCPEASSPLQAGVTEMDFDGQITLYISDERGHVVKQERYDGKLVVTAHATLLDPDPDWPDNVARELDMFMRYHNLSRLEAYWNAVPPFPEGCDDRRDECEPHHQG